MDLDSIFTSAIVPRPVREVVIGLWGNDEAKQNRRVAYPMAWEWPVHQSSRLYSRAVEVITGFGNWCGLCDEHSPQVWNGKYQHTDRIWQRSVLYTFLSIAAFVTIQEAGKSPWVMGAVVATVSLPATLGGASIWLMVEGSRLLYRAVQEGCWDSLSHSFGLFGVSWFIQENYDIFPTLLDHFSIAHQAPKTRGS